MPAQNRQKPLASARPPIGVGGRRGLSCVLYIVYMEIIMTDDRTKEIQELYRRAFREFGTVALWNMRPVQAPTPADALAITTALRTHGRMDGRRLAERIEEICRAAQ
jgi:hypothetical protein